MDRVALDALWTALADGPRVHDVATRGARRSRGVVFTPAPLAAFVARHTLAPLVGRGAVRVLDPAAGDGRFLAAAADALVELGVPRSNVTLIGVERDPALAAAARARVPAARIVVGEALLDPAAAI